jgi:hypothetical protein
MFLCKPKQPVHQTHALQIDNAPKVLYESNRPEVGDHGQRRTREKTVRVMQHHARYADASLTIPSQRLQVLRCSKTQKGQHHMQPKAFLHLHGVYVAGCVPEVNATLEL